MDRKLNAQEKINKLHHLLMEEQKHAAQDKRASDKNPSQYDQATSVYKASFNQHNQN